LEGRGLGGAAPFRPRANLHITGSKKGKKKPVNNILKFNTGRDYGEGVQAVPQRPSEEKGQVTAGQEFKL